MRILTARLLEDEDFVLDARDGKFRSCSSEIRLMGVGIVNDDIEKSLHPDGSMTQICKLRFPAATTMLSWDDIYCTGSWIDNFNCNVNSEYAWAG